MEMKRYRALGNEWETKWKAYDESYFKDKNDTEIDFLCEKHR